MDIRKLSSLMVAVLAAAVAGAHPGSDLMLEDGASFLLLEGGTDTLTQEG